MLNFSICNNMNKILYFLFSQISNRYSVSVISDRAVVLMRLRNNTELCRHVISVSIVFWNEVDCAQRTRYYSTLSVSVASFHKSNWTEMYNFLGHCKFYAQKIVEHGINLHPQNYRTFLKVNTLTISHFPVQIVRQFPGAVLH